MEMNDVMEAFYRQVNVARYQRQIGGHYESYFLRANHPSRPLAFWIRYTIFSPKNRPEQALGELWAIFFNGENGRHVAIKQEAPMAECHFDRQAFNVRVKDATLGDGHLQGAVATEKHTIAWDLGYEGSAGPLLLLPLSMYRGKFPAAKSLVSVPMARFRGRLTIDDQPIEVEDWLGSQNHNWGSRHTDLYAWGQVAGFDHHPQSFLEVATAKLRLGGFWTPPITPLVLRHNGREYALNSLLQSLKAEGAFDYFTWRFKSGNEAIHIEGKINAPREAFVGLKYYNPPGGTRQCLNSKIAACRLVVRDKTTGQVDVLETANRAAFEILTDDESHHIQMAV